MVSPRVVLVGPMGSGKSTVAALVAQRLGVAPLDTDQLVEARAGRSVAEVFAADGEAAFRALERRAVHEALTGHGGVVSLGGGAVLDPATRAELAGLPVVALEVTWRWAQRRLGAAVSRPLLAADPRRRWEEITASRAALYAEVAVAQVDTDGTSPEEVADRVVAAIEASAEP